MENNAPLTIRKLFNFTALRATSFNQTHEQKRNRKKTTNNNIGLRRRSHVYIKCRLMQERTVCASIDKHKTVHTNFTIEKKILQFCIIHLLFFHVIWCLSLQFTLFMPFLLLFASCFRLCQFN